VASVAETVMPFQPQTPMVKLGVHKRGAPKMSRAIYLQLGGACLALSLAAGHASAADPKFLGYLPPGQAGQIWAYPDASGNWCGENVAVSVLTTAHITYPQVTSRLQFIGLQVAKNCKTAISAKVAVYNADRSIAGPSVVVRKDDKWLVAAAPPPPSPQTVAAPIEAPSPTPAATTAQPSPSAQPAASAEGNAPSSARMASPQLPRDTNYSSAMIAFLHANPALTQDDGIIRYWASYRFPDEYHQFSHDEFKLRPVIQQAKADLGAALAQTDGRHVTATVEAQIGAYDFDTHQFPITLNLRELTVRKPGGFDFSSLPGGFVLNVSDGDIIKAFPMDPNAAQSFTENRKNSMLGYRAVLVAVTVKLDETGLTKEDSGSIDGGGTLESVAIYGDARAQQRLFQVSGVELEKMRAARTAEQAAGGSPSSAQGGEAYKAAPIAYLPLFNRYISARPDLANDPTFVEMYAKYTRCEDWRKVYQNEFKYKPFLADTKGIFVAAATKPSPELLQLKMTGSFGQYDFDKKQFPFRPFPDGTQFAFAMNGFTSGGGLVSNCMPMYEKWPAKVIVRITNPWIIDGLPMGKDDAQRLVDRNPNSYSRELGVNVVLKIAKVGDPKADPSQYIGFAEAVADAEIVSATVDDGARNAPKTIFTMDDVYVKQRVAAQAAAKHEEAAATEGSVDATADVVQKYVEKFSKTPTEQPKLTPDDPAMRLLVNMNISFHKADGSGTVGFGDAATIDLGLQDGTYFTARGSIVQLRLDNAAEFKGVKVPSDIADFARGSFPNMDVTLFIKPTGYVHDDYLGAYMMDHITKVAVTLSKPNGGGDRAKKVWTFESGQPLKPFNPLADQRTGADFDVLGVKGGMSPDDVRSAAEKELGQKLVFDEKAMSLSSPVSECEFTFDSNKTPPGRKCFKADFRVKEKGVFGNKLGLARATYRQAIFRKSGADLKGLLTSKYGPSAYETQVNTTLPVPAASLVDLDKGLISHPVLQQSFWEWGKRLTTDRKGMVTEQVRVPVHVLEAEIAMNGDMVHLTTTLTDELLVSEQNAAKAAADAAKKADEDKKKGADVKL